MSKMLSNVLLVLFGTLVTVMLYEVAYRLWLHVTPEQEARNTRPSFYYTYESGRTLSEYSYEKKKPANTYRIVVIGDSFTFPTHMQFDDAFPKRLERMLNMEWERNKPEKVEVINTGRMGQSSVQEYQRLRRIMRYEPDMVILEITLNDPEQRNFHETLLKHPGKYTFGELKITKELHPFLYYFKGIGLIARHIHNQKTVSSLAEYYHDLYRKDSDSWKSFVAAIQHMHDDCQNKQVAFAAVVFPFFNLPLDHTYPFRDLHQQIADELDGMHVSHLDLLSAYEGIPIYQLQVVVGKDSHPNEIAHRIAAENIYLWFEQNKMVPGEFLIQNKYAHRGIHAKRLAEGEPVD